MAVQATAGPVMRPWPQRTERDPIAQWFFRVAATGDATGGNLVVEAVFSRGLLWSLDGHATLDSTLENVAVVLATNDGESGFSVQWTSVLVAAAAGLGNGLQGDTMLLPFYALFFRPTTAVGQLQWSVANALAKVLTGIAWGYCWDQKAMSILGGPLRP